MYTNVSELVDSLCKDDADMPKAPYYSLQSPERCASKPFEVGYCQWSSSVSAPKLAKDIATRKLAKSRRLSPYSSFSSFCAHAAVHCASVSRVRCKQ